MARSKPKPKVKPFYHVAVGAVVRVDEVLIAKRAEHKLQGGRWEFPGGKLEAGEAVIAGLARELDEELGIRPQQQRPLIKITYDYEEFETLLDVWRIEEFSGTPHARENQEFQWVKISDLDNFAFPDANVPIVRAIQLPSVYVFSSNATYFECDPTVGAERSSARGSNYVRPLHEVTNLVRIRKGNLPVQEYCNMVNAKSHLPHNIMLDLPAYNENLSVAGLHLTSKEIYQFEQRPIAKNKLLAASLHTVEDIQQANKLAVDFAVLSPVRETPSHPDAQGIGWEKFAELIREAHFPVYALGGMTPEDLEMAWAHGAQGVAGISLGAKT